MRCAGVIFLTGLCEKETEAGRDVFFWEKNMELPHCGGAGGLPQKTLRWKPTRTALHFGMCYLTHDLEGLDVDFFLHKNKVLHSDVVGVLVHLLRKRAPWNSCTPPMLSSPLPYCNTLQAGVAGVFSALHHMWKAW